MTLVVAKLRSLLLVVAALVVVLGPWTVSAPASAAATPTRFGGPCSQAVSDVSAG